LVQIFDIAYKADTKFTLDSLFFSRKDTWANYLMGVMDEIQKAGYPLQGANLIFINNIPQGVGLSSSAALEVVTAFTMMKLNSLEIKLEKIARLCWRAENNFIRVTCGIMDQYVSCLGQKNHALFIDCRTNDYEPIPFKNHNYQIVICNSKIQRKLIDSEYNKRKEECKKAIEIFKSNLKREIRALRDVTLDEYRKFQSKLPEIIARRARHVILENCRVLSAVKALKIGSYSTFGQLMIESHQSLKTDYEVSCDELDLLVELAIKQDGVLGARMTGAGFGGCTVNLLKREFVNIFKETIQKEYYKITGITQDIYLSSATDGAKVIELIR